MAPEPAPGRLQLGEMGAAGMGDSARGALQRPRWNRHDGVLGGLFDEAQQAFERVDHGLFAHRLAVAGKH